MQMEFINKRTIKLDKIMNELDKFILEFIKILEKHTDYVVVSGYVSILFGRARATEDIDILIKRLNKEKLSRLYNDLKKHGYWCLNTDNFNKIYSYLDDKLAVRFALKNETIPNVEVKFANNRLAREALKDTLDVMTKLGKIKISSIERQIAVKRYYLKSDKDLEDAKHLEELFKEHIDKSKINEYKKIIQNEMA
ncbi:hypothetical protein A3K72_00340 [Candidatus Woesearchaeota archaeon RBG_13_36_6]|nr:MAG: hypothetical protein A3K72_00340 [Candidatus Woesearchaeota archaeon RBG_13_36_6]